jgi:hypothetical protein
MVDVLKDQMEFDFVKNCSRGSQLAPKRGGKHSGKSKKLKFTREESAHILGRKYNKSDDAF